MKLISLISFLSLITMTPSVLGKSPHHDNEGSVAKVSTNEFKEIFNDQIIFNYTKEKLHLQAISNIIENRLQTQFKLVQETKLQMRGDSLWNSIE